MEVSSKPEISQEEKSAEKASMLTCSHRNDSDDSDDSIDSDADYPHLNCKCFHCAVFGTVKEEEASRTSGVRKRLEKRLNVLKIKNSEERKENPKENPVDKPQSDVKPAEIDKKSKDSIPVSQFSEEKPKTEELSNEGKADELKHQKVPTKHPQSNVKPADVPMAKDTKQKNSEKPKDPIPASKEKPKTQEKSAKPPKVEMKSVGEVKVPEEDAKKKKTKPQQVGTKKAFEEQFKRLQEVNAELSEADGLIKQVNNKLGQLNSTNGRNKFQKLNLAKDEAKNLGKWRQNLVKDARSIFKAIKDLKPDVDLIQECGEMNAVMTLLVPPPKPVTPKPKEEKPQEIETAIPEVPSSVPAPSQLYTMVDGKFVPVQLKLDAPIVAEPVVKPPMMNGGGEAQMPAALPYGNVPYGVDFATFYKAFAMQPRPMYSTTSEMNQKLQPSMSFPMMRDPPKAMPAPPPAEPKFESMLVKNEKGIYTVRKSALPPDVPQPPIGPKFDSPMMMFGDLLSNSEGNVSNVLNHRLKL